jgi:uncharacterized protein
MSETPFAQIAGLRIGTVDFVSPDEIKVQLEIEAPDSVALNAGGVRPFPRVNGYVLLPVDDRFLVGQIEWLTVERSAFPKRQGVKDFGLIDLPFPLRKMSLNPVGTLRRETGGTAGAGYVFRRGAEALPTIGSAVLLPTEEQLRSIVESGERRRVKLGTSPLANDATVCVDPDRIFGRHLAVLGNTGSGKSCSVAGLIRWSLEAAAQAKSEQGSTDRSNARFIVLDPNGEYARAFVDAGAPKSNVRVLSVHPGQGEDQFRLPYWFWNSNEWSAFTQASSRAQRPLLRRALRDLKSASRGTLPTTEEQALAFAARQLSMMLTRVRGMLNSDEPRSKSIMVADYLKGVQVDLSNPELQLAGLSLGGVSNAVEKALLGAAKPGSQYYQAFSIRQLRQIEAQLVAVLCEVGVDTPLSGVDEDAPVPFDVGSLATHIDLLAQADRTTQFSDFLVMRVRTLLADERARAILGSDQGLTLEGWLESCLGGAGDGGVDILVVDLSLVPSELVHVVTAVLGRMIFEALQRYRKLNQRTLPTVLVMEEAHTFVRRYNADSEGYDAAAICCQVFERIAREGRKFGLGLVLSSQRPSELSPTVLSQCNTFLLHRISNDRDQDIVHKLVPDNLRGLLRELPTLPSQQAILLGWASELPVLVKMRDLPTDQRPNSDDPDFWNVWVGKDEEGKAVERPVDWKAVADDWQGAGRSSDTGEILNPSGEAGPETEDDDDDIPF